MEKRMFSYGRQQRNRHKLRGAEKDEVITKAQCRGCGIIFISSLFPRQSSEVTVGISLCAKERTQYD
jgi:hypothetical protein